MVSKKIDKLYKDICRVYFPRWKPRIYSYIPEWGYSGECDNKAKRIIFGNQDPQLIIHEICHAVTLGSHGIRWQTRMIKAAEIAKQYDPVLSKRLVDDKDISAKAVKMPRTYLYIRIADTFYSLYSENDPSSINVSHCINYLLAEEGIRKESSGKQYSQMFNRGEKIAAQQSKLVQRR